MELPLEPLYLGRYQILERPAPDGMVIDPEPNEVVLSYASQEVEITSASVGFYNERQKVKISLKKLLEQDETFSIGMHEEWKNSPSACSPQRKWLHQTVPPSR